MKRKYTLLFIFIGVAYMACEDDLDDAGNTPNILSNFANGYMGEASPGEKYVEYEENPFVEVRDQHVSTFSIDADGASYSNVRRFLKNGIHPPKGAIRTEELINYFQYDYKETSSVHPVSLNGEVSQCPWNSLHRLIRIGIRGKEITRAALPPSNFVLLIDISGSMGSENKLELLKNSFSLFIDEMRAEDKIAIVTYAGNSGVALKATSGDQKNTIKAAIQALGSGGSTAGAEGIITAYEIARENFITGGNNRVILGTDGDFNVGPSSLEELIELIESKRDQGIFLTVLGVGEGNLNDAGMEQLANNGNGNYEYIDNIDQARKVFIHEFSKFYTVAKDVKVQVAFNATLVKAYRLIGYENRLLETDDFENDKKDAGEIGAGQQITALYEIKPASSPALRSVPTFTIDFRYKLPDEDHSIPLTLKIFDQGKLFDQASENMRFAGSVAAYGMLLWDSDYKGNANYEAIRSWAMESMNYNPHQYKNEFLELIEIAKSLQ